jgi:hypothetical protein
VLLDLTETDVPLTARECTRAYATLSWTCEQIFLLTASWLDSIDRAETKVALSVAARVFGWQAEQWRALVPESVLLEDDRSAAPTPSARDAIAALAASEPPRRAESIGALASAMRDEVDLLTARLSPVSDGAAARLAEFLRGDLVRVSGALAG